MVTSRKKGLNKIRLVYSDQIKKQIKMNSFNTFVEGIWQLGTTYFLIVYMSVGVFTSEIISV